MKLKMITMLVATSLSASAFAASSMEEQVVSSDSSNTINLRNHSDYSRKMLSSQKVTNKTSEILNARLAKNSVYVGGRGEVYLSYATTSGAKATNIVDLAGTSDMRDTNNRSNTSLEMPYFDLGVTATIGDMVTGFFDLQSNTSSTSSSVSLPNAYIVIGDLEKSPMYGFLGKKVVDFGNFSSVNNFMPTLTRSYFMSYGQQIGFGYTHDGVEFTATFMNGNGKGMMNSQASNANQLNNMAANLSYHSKSEIVGYYAGVGYANATGFSNNFAADKNAMVGAVDMNAGMNVGSLQFNGEFVMTTSGVKSMNRTSPYASVDGSALREYLNAQNPSSANIKADTVGINAFGINALPIMLVFGTGSTSTVKAWSLNTSYSMPVSGKHMTPYFSYSQVAQNGDNTIYQFEAGTRYEVTSGMWLGASYNYMSGTALEQGMGSYNTVMLNTGIYF